jgi:hypothetical protein
VTLQLQAGTRSLWSCVCRHREGREGASMTCSSWQVPEGVTLPWFPLLSCPPLPTAVNLTFSSPHLSSQPVFAAWEIESRLASGPSSFVFLATRCRPVFASSKCRWKSVNVFQPRFILRRPQINRHISSPTSTGICSLKFHSRQNSRVVRDISELSPAFVLEHPGYSRTASKFFCSKSSCCLIF